MVATPLPPAIARRDILNKSVVTPVESSVMSSERPFPHECKSSFPKKAGFLNVKLWLPTVKCRSPINADMYIDIQVPKPAPAMPISKPMTNSEFRTTFESNPSTDIAMDTFECPSTRAICSRNSLHIIAGMVTAVQKP